MTASEAKQHRPFEAGPRYARTLLAALSRWLQLRHVVEAAEGFNASKATQSIR